MKTTPATVPPYVINLFFIFGLISAIAFRAIIVFKHTNPEWVRPVWYIAIVCNLAFFLYRYMISRKRRKAVEEYRLIEKLGSDDALDSGDRAVLVYLLSSIKKSRENLNYLIIFALSAIAVCADIVLTLQGK